MSDSYLIISMEIAALVSGGVDSSVVVHQLKEAGYDPTIFYIRIGMEDKDGYIDCPAEEDIEITSYIAKKYGCRFEIVSLHIPATEQTKKSINYDLLKDMPKGAVLVNTARKEVIDEEGLAKLMEERADFHYITDIAPDCDCFSKFEGRFFATPKKMGAQTEEANVNAGLAAAHQIVNFIEKGDEKFRVNK